MCPGRVGALCSNLITARMRKAADRILLRMGAVVRAVSPTILGEVERVQKTGLGAEGLLCCAAKGLACPHPPLPPGYKLATAHGTDSGACFFCEAAWEGLSQDLGLSPREVEILQCVMSDFGEEATAAFLEISPHTVRTHLVRIHKKLGVHSRTVLIARLCYVHLHWRCQAAPPGCRVNIRIVQIA